jgi:hypothetical protein
MTLPENMSLENKIINTEISLELFRINEQSRVDGSRYLYIPEEVLKKHFNKNIYRKNADKEIKNEFKFLYRKNGLSIEMMLISANNYKKVLEMNNPTEYIEQVRKEIEKFDNIENINLKLKPKGYHMDGVPSEFRRIGNQVDFLAEDEPYIHMNMFLNYLI